MPMEQKVRLVRTIGHLKELAPEEIRFMLSLAAIDSPAARDTLLDQLLIWEKSSPRLAYKASVELANTRFQTRYELARAAAEHLDRGKIVSKNLLNALLEDKHFEVREALAETLARKEVLDRVSPEVHERLVLHIEAGETGQLRKPTGANTSPPNAPKANSTGWLSRIANWRNNAKERKAAEIRSILADPDLTPDEKWRLQRKVAFIPSKAEKVHRWIEELSSNATFNNGISKLQKFRGQLDDSSLDQLMETVRSVQKNTDYRKQFDDADLSRIAELIGKDQWTESRLRTLMEASLVRMDPDIHYFGNHPESAYRNLLAQKWGRLLNESHSAGDHILRAVSQLDPVRRHAVLGLMLQNLPKEMRPDAVSRLVASAMDSAGEIKMQYGFAIVQPLKRVVHLYPPGPEHAAKVSKLMRDPDSDAAQAGLQLFRMSGDWRTPDTIEAYHELIFRPARDPFFWWNPKAHPLPPGSLNEVEAVAARIPQVKDLKRLEAVREFLLHQGIQDQPKIAKAALKQLASVGDREMDVLSSILLRQLTSAEVPDVLRAIESSHPEVAERLLWVLAHVDPVELGQRGLSFGEVRPRDWLELPFGAQVSILKKFESAPQAASYVFVAHPHLVDQQTASRLAAYARSKTGTYELRIAAARALSSPYRASPPVVLDTLLSIMEERVKRGIDDPVFSEAYGCLISGRHGDLTVAQKKRVWAIRKRLPDDAYDVLRLLSQLAM